MITPIRTLPLPVAAALEAPAGADAPVEAGGAEVGVEEDEEHALSARSPAAEPAARSAHLARADREVTYVMSST
jgi:hypothetical protein